MNADMTHHERIFQWDFTPTEFTPPFRVEDHPLWHQRLDAPCPIAEDEHVGNWDDAENGCTCVCFWHVVMDANGVEVFRTPDEEAGQELRNLLNSVLPSRFTLAGEPLTAGGAA